MADDLRKKLEEVYARKMEAEKNKPASPKAPNVEKMQGLLGFDTDLPDFSGDFCSDAQNTIDFMQRFVKQWKWLIPDKWEKPVMALLDTIEEALLPVVCVAPAVSGTAAGTEAKAKTNFGPKKA